MFWTPREQERTAIFLAITLTLEGLLRTDLQLAFPFNLHNSNNVSLNLKRLLIERLNFEIEVKSEEVLDRDDDEGGLWGC